ncbi:ATP-binding protein [Sphaerisporangium sp. NPDC051017]|uniref:ATP-binding protein n=1 Tax=Sphaerisporangium sp. NPDC051017 TaxID=3154636 RepID=UPI0034383BAB
MAEEKRMREARGTRSVFLGQFRLTRLQVVNWGTFCGYKDFPIDERGVLFTGPSGSGKSSLMDAHSVALLPTREQRFNASADLTARGAKQGSRSTPDYVRGAWSETNDEHGQSQVRYLRAGKPTWSAVAATYDDGLGQVTTAVVVKWFSGSETDGAALKTMYQLHHGQFDLNLLDEWATHGEGFDTRWFRTAHPASYPDSQDAYMRELAKRVGLGTSKTALALLGKAKAMKNVGDLNLFIRDNMLDEPATFAAAQKMIESFNPLNDAFETARRARDQAKTLQEVPAHWTTYLAAKDIASRAGVMLGPPVEHYLRGIHLQVLRTEIDRLKASVTLLRGQLDRQNQESSAAEKLYLSLTATCQTG